MMKNSLSFLEYKDDDFYYMYAEEHGKKGETCYNTHSHPRHEIMYISEGSVEYLVENRRHELKAGDVLLVKPGLMHVARRITESPSARSCIGFFPSSLENGRLAEKLFDKGEHFSVGENSVFAKTVALLKTRLEESKKHSALFAKHMMDSMILSLDEEGLDEEKSADPTDKGLRRIISYISSNLVSINTIEDIAEGLFFSKSYLGHLFKRETGMGIMEYVRNKKVILAHRRIADGEKPTEIYTECGFSNYPSFYRAYCAYFGSSPRNLKTNKNRV